MVDFKIVFCLIEFILCILYNGAALIVIPDCIESIAFYAKIVAAAHLDVREQIQSLKLVIVHILLVLVVIKVTLLRFWIRTEEDLLCNRESCLCNKCLQKEQEREILKGLLISEQAWLHKFCKESTPFLIPDVNIRVLWQL